VGGRPVLLGLRIRLGGVVLLAVLISQSILAWLLLGDIRNRMIQGAMAGASAVARSVERSTAQPHAGRPRGGTDGVLLQVLSAHLAEEDLLGLALRDRSGRVVASQGRPVPPPGASWGGVPGGEHLLLQGEPPLLATRREIRHQQEPLELLLLYSLERQAPLATYAQQKALLQIGASALLLFLFLVATVHQGVIRPLRRFGAGFSALEHGDLSHRIPPETRDELGSLAEAFNRMAATLEESRVTIRRQMEELAEAHRETLTTRERYLAAEKLASLGTLSAGLAHEVGNPLAAVIGYIELLKSGTLSAPQVAACLADASRELHRIHLTMLELLDYARPSREPAEPLDVNEVVQSVVQGCAADPETSGVTISLDLAAGLPPLPGHAHRLEGILGNLLQNAAWATGGRGTVLVSTRRAEGGGALLVSCRDDGRGISPQDLERIFDPFFTTRPGGTGLGLAITRRMVEEMGGSIGVESRVGSGTTFTLRFPLAEDPSPAAALPLPPVGADRATGEGPQPFSRGGV
jgi:signal transduction histidine kinase